MPFFRILIPVTGFAAYEVEAEDSKKAKELVLEGNGEWRHSEYNESTDSNSWDVDSVS